MDRILSISPSVCSLNVAGEHGGHGPGSLHRAHHPPSPSPLPAGRRAADAPHAGHLHDCHGLARYPRSLLATAISSCCAHSPHGQELHPTLPLRAAMMSPAHLRRHHTGCGHGWRDWWRDAAPAARVSGVFVALARFDRSDPHGVPSMVPRTQIATKRSASASVSNSASRPPFNTTCSEIVHFMITHPLRHMPCALRTVAFEGLRPVRRAGRKAWSAPGKTSHDPAPLLPLQSAASGRPNVRCRYNSP